MAITFTRRTVTYASDDTQAVVESTISAAVIKRMRGNPDRYRDLGLVLGRDPTLIVVPDTYGDRIEPGDTFEWPAVGDVYTVRDVLHVDPDGVVIQSEIIASK